MDTKTCTKCHETKPVEDFSFSNKSKGTRQSRCRVCKRADQKIHDASPAGKEAERIRNATPERRAARKKYQDTPAAKEAKRIRNATPVAKETQRIYKASPEGQAGKKRCRQALIEANRWYEAECTAKNRVKAAGCYYEYVSYVAVYERDNWICQWCNRPIDPEEPSMSPMEATIDHITPVVAGGPHQMDNLQAMHRGCNAEKGIRENDPDQQILPF